MGRLFLFPYLIICLLTPQGQGDEGNAKHWAFQKVRHIYPPQVRQAEAVRTPVDTFILARLDQEGLKPTPEADRETLLRRVCFVLTGLPPTSDEVERARNDRQEDWYERLVERLLASPHYGERWGQHWLDVVRFAESNGYEGDGFRPHAWRYRDYVARSLNLDKPYDVFLTEQLCGDLLAKEAEGPRKHELLIAAGMHRCGPAHLVGGNVNPETLRQEFLTEITDAVGSVFLGLTMGCTRCHDHKFDPLSQKDYYSLEAFFGAAYPKEVSFAATEEQERYSRRVKELDDRIAPLKKEVAAIDAPHRTRLTEQKKARLEPEYRKALAVDARERTPEQHRLVLNAQPLLKVTWDEILDSLSPKEAEKRAELRRQMHDLQALMPPPPAHAWTLVAGKLTPSHVLRRGSIKHKGEKVDPDYPAVLAEVCTPDPAKEKQDRIALARWLTRSDHPLTARVIVNRLWQHHFGKGLVRTTNDFGTRGDTPSHPELLDWLAQELIRNGWSLKHLHRQIVLSATFRQDSRRRDVEAEKRDGDNRLLWRMNRLRLDAEALRDSTLAVTGMLNRSLTGPSVFVPLEKEVYDLIFTEGEPDGLWHATPDRTQHQRRSLYLYRKRNVRLPMLEAFDQPDTLTSCAQRSNSTFAPQALILLNGPFQQEQSRAFAERLRQQGGADKERVRTAFLLAFGREPRATELTDSLAFLDAQSTFLLEQMRKDTPAFTPDEARKRALDDFCLALLNRNEFLYVR